MEMHPTDSSGLGPVAEREISLLFVNEDDHIPDQPESEGTNSDTDPEDLAAGPMESKLAQFASVLCVLLFNWRRKEKGKKHTLGTPGPPNTAVTRLERSWLHRASLT